MIPIILFLSFTSSTATSAKPPAFARCANWLMLLASPASLRMVSASCLFSRGMTSAETTACLTYSLTRNPASPGSLPDGVILQLGQFRTDNPLLLLYPFLCRTSPRLVLYTRHGFLRLNGVLKIATNGRNFLCGEQSKVVSVYRNITLLSK